MSTTKLIRVSFLCALCGLVLSILLISSGGTAYAKSTSIHANNSVQTSSSLDKVKFFHGQKKVGPGAFFNYSCPASYTSISVNSDVSEVGSSAKPVAGTDYTLTNSLNPPQFVFDNKSTTLTLILVYSGFCEK